MKNRLEQLKRNIGKFHKGGVIVEVKNCDEAKIAEQAGAVAVRVMEQETAPYYESSPNDLELLEQILKETSISVIGKIRIGHYIEARILEEVGVHFIEESEVLQLVDETPILKEKFRTPFISSYRDFPDVVKKLGEGVSLLRTAEGNLANTVQFLRNVQNNIQQINHLDEEHLFIEAVNLGLPVDILKEIKAYGRLPIANFASGGISTPADAALVRKLGADGVILGNEIFSLNNPLECLRIFIQSTINYEDYVHIKELCKEFQHVLMTEEEPSLSLEQSTVVEAEV